MSKAQTQARLQAQARARIRRGSAPTNEYASVVNYLLLVMLFLAPFFRGLFFYDELLVAHIYTGAIAAIYFYFNREKLMFSKNVMDYAGFCLVLAYVLSSFVAVNLRDGVGLVMKLINYLLVYWLIALTAKETEKMKNVLVTFFVAGFAIALTGIGTAFGTFSFNGAYYDGLIATTIQYHNAGAIYLFAAGMIGLILPGMFQGGMLRATLTGLNYIIFITATGAGSRGALLVAPVAMLIQFIGLPKADKEKYFYTVLSVLLPLVITAKSVLTFHQNSEGFYWAMLLIGFIMAALMQFGFDRFTLLSGKLKKNYLVATAAIIGVAIAAVLIIKGHDIMPTSVSDRLQDVNLKIDSVQDRFNFWSDAGKIITDHPILGVGGGGWKWIYRSYQSYSYDTTEVHNHFLQVWVESGTVGFACYILLWIGLLISSIKILLRSQSPQIKAITWTAFSVAVALGMHSAIDFTLSESAVVFFLWAMMGLVKSGEEQTQGQENGYFLNLTLSPTIKRAVGITVSLVFFIVSTSLYIGVLKADAALDNYQNGDMDGAISDMEAATFFDPLSSTNFLNLSQIYVEKASQKMDTQLISKSLKAAEAAARLNTADSETQGFLAKAYFNTRNFEKGTEFAEKVVTLAPFVTDGYIQLAMYYNSVAGEYLKMGDKDSARKLAEKTLQIPQRIEAQAAKLTEEGKKLSKKPLDKNNPQLQKFLDEAQKLKASL